MVTLTRRILRGVDGAKNGAAKFGQNADEASKVEEQDEPNDQGHQYEADEEREEAKEHQSHRNPDKERAEGGGRCRFGGGSDVC
jgi:hypothetical protein